MGEENIPTPDTPGLDEVVDSLNPTPAAHPEILRLSSEKLAKLQDTDIEALVVETTKKLIEDGIPASELAGKTQVNKERSVIHKGNVVMIPHWNPVEWVFLSWWLPPGSQVHDPYRVNVTHPKKG